MKKKYVYSLVIIGILILSLLIIGTGYGLWLSTKDTDSKNATTLQCFKIYFSTDDTIKISNIKPILNEEGKETSPHTITITNICQEEKEIQLRLNVLNETTTDINSLVINTTGAIEKNEHYYKDLDNSKTTNESAIYSKLIGTMKVEPGKTVRTNVKLWFDEKKSYEITKEDIFVAQLEIVDKDSSVKPTFSENILLENPDFASKEAPNFAVAATTDQGLYLLTENNKNTYYFRGNAQNNYVSFADQLWRIVRINSDNSVRLILNKPISYLNYSEFVNSQDYTGLKYVYNNELIDNTINNYLINWYNENILSKNLDKYVSASPFCNDSTNYINYYHTYFYGYDRLVTNKIPTTICPETTIDFGGTIEQKIGLITADEVALAGGVYMLENYNYYLSNGEPFFTMTPSEYYNYGAYIFTVSENGAITSKLTNQPSGVRPVININSTATISGQGTIDNPFVIDLD